MAQVNLSDSNNTITKMSVSDTEELSLGEALAGIPKKTKNAIRFHKGQVTTQFTTLNKLKVSINNERTHASIMSVSKRVEDMTEKVSEHSKKLVKLYEDFLLGQDENLNDEGYHIMEEGIEDGRKREHPHVSSMSFERNIKRLVLSS